MGQSAQPQGAAETGRQPSQTRQAPQPGPTGGQAGQQQLPAPYGGRPSGRSLLRPVSVEDVVAEEVATAQPDTPIRTVVAQMSERDVGSVVVVDDGQPVGILTDRMVALALEDEPNVEELSAEALMTDDPITADTSTDVFQALQLMRDEEIRRLPVVDDEKSLQGIVTLDDALVLLGSELDKLATTVQEQSPRL